jgi:putative effector of murein hydrolase
MSLLWVGGYGYTYTDPFYNSSPVNWLAFILWAPGLFLTLRSYRLFLRYIKRPWLGIMVTWIAYFASLLLVEHIGYNVLTIRQVTSEGPLIFGLIHGTIPLKIYYVGAGIFAVFLSNILGKLLAPPYRIKKPLGKGVAGQPCRYDYHKESL